MYKTRIEDAGKTVGYVEMDPAHRYGRFKEVLGKGATKTVYRAFDEIVGMEVAWNQVKLNDAFRSPEELQRLYSEVHLLNNLNHHSIMRFYTSWIDVDKSSFNFITEMFTSGTLREYRRRFKGVNIRAIKGWARQIIEGVNYLHCHNPPVIHRDLKCDNIFVNGHLGQVKIGDLGLAAILRGSHHAHSVIGTPEFMAPELYEEEYDELVDIYSFGMCILEMITGEYPYRECSNPAQIYKKVTSGKLPAAFYLIEDVEAQRFVGRCLEKAHNRPSACELLMDPFLSIEQVPVAEISIHKAVTSEAPARKTEMLITGSMDPEQDAIFLKVQISDKDGPSRNIYFPFDITSDTSLDVAAEMVEELEIIDWEPTQIANMIDREISTLVPSWKVSVTSSVTSFSQMQQQHSFTYSDDEDENDNVSPHFASSFCSSQVSPFSFHDDQFLYANPPNDWLTEEANVNDDTSSQSSSYSHNYANLKYYSVNEDNFLQSFQNENLYSIRCTRFGPEGSTSKLYNNVNAVLSHRSKHRQKMVRTASLVDIRSQLLHRTLVEEINKRRMFNTVGAVENIGYREPGDQFYD